MTSQCTKDISKFVYAETTKDHSTRVGEGLAILIETSMDIGVISYNEDLLKQSKQAGLYHDIGKVNIDDYILSKSGKLSPEEYSIIKKHPLYGADIIRTIIGVSYVYEAALSHHERWDGTGYPFNLKGESIPIIGRACAIVDAFDVIIHDRSYKKASSIEEGFSEILRCSGSHFDPDLVKCFESCYKKLK